MPRRQRSTVTGYPYHIIIRGNNRIPMFRRDADRLRFLTSLEAYSRATGVQVHTYCFMTNHVHALMTSMTPTGLSVCLQGIGRRYVRYFNDRYERTGALWEGRFRSFLIAGDAYLLMCGRYIELNPVRAGLVQGPGEWTWSGYRTRADGVPDSLLQPDPGYLSCGDDESERQRRYRAWVAQGIPMQELTAIRRCVQQSSRFGMTLNDQS